MSVLIVVLLHAVPIHATEKAYSCIVHVHSKISGEENYSLPELTEKAEAYGVDVVLLTEYLNYTIEYGVPMLRHVLWLNHTGPSVMKAGPVRYLSDVERENKRQGAVLYIPGLEVCPRFYWSGSLGHDLVCHDHQRNLMVVGTDKADVIKHIPEACGYVWSKDWLWVISTRFLVGLFAVLCIMLIPLPAYLARRSPYTRKAIRRSMLFGMVMPVAVVILVLNVVASFVPRFNIYGAAGTMEYAQKVIDYLGENNLIHYWGSPEAADNHDISYMRLKFNAHTEPYPEVVKETSGYTGIAGMYEARNTLIKPGGIWDEVLNEHLAGKRDQPVWCFGEMLYHYEGHAGKKLNNVETMVWAEEKTQDAILSALRQGRFYVRKNIDGKSLELDKFDVFRMGDKHVKIDCNILATEPDEKIKVDLIRNGVVIKTVEAVAPVEFSVDDDISENKFGVYYRVMVTWKNVVRLTTNPVFVK